MKASHFSKLLRIVFSALLSLSIVAMTADISDAKRSGGGGRGAKMHVHKGGGGKRPGKPAQLPSTRPGKPAQLPSKPSRPGKPVGPGKPGRPDYRPPHHYHNADKWHKGYNYYGRWVAGAATAAAIGTILYSLPPACRVIYANGLRYWECGGVYYQQQYQGSQVVYVVVQQP